MQESIPKANKTYLILAHGKQGKYYHFAYNLALSLKMQGANIPITLLTDQNKPLGTKHMRVFDHVVKFKKEAYAGRKAITPFYAKTWLYDHSPADRTIYLDADGWAMQNPDSLFDKFQGKPFQSHCVGTWPYETCGESNIIWSDPQKLYTKYGIDRNHYFTEHNSSFIYFEKSDTAKNIFRLAEYFYSTEYVPGYKHDGFFHYPDELAFSTACLSIDYRPGRFRPIYFHETWNLDRRKLPAIEKNYYFGGLYGNKGLTAQTWWNHYNRKIQSFYWAQDHKLYPTGFKMRPDDKASERGKKNPRYEGIKPFTERPSWVDELIGCKNFVS